MKKMIDNPILECKRQAMDLGYIIEEESFDGEYKRLKCIRHFRERLHGEITQWEADEYVGLPLKTHQRWVLEFTLQAKPTGQTFSHKQKYATEKEARQAEEALRSEGGVWDKRFFEVIKSKIYEI